MKRKDQMASKKELEKMEVTEVLNWQEYQNRRSELSGKGSGGGTAQLPSIGMLQVNVDKITGKPLYEGMLVPKLLGEVRVDVIYDSGYITEYFANLLSSINAIDIDEATGKVNFTSVFERFFNKETGSISEFAQTIISKRQAEEESKKARVLMAQFPGMSLDMAINYIREMKKNISSSTTGASTQIEESIATTEDANGKQKAGAKAK